MSDMSAGQIVGGIIGAVVGFYTMANPYAGAVQGAALGAGIGGYIDPPKNNIRQPAIGDASFQSAAYGVPIPRLYGRIAVHGNVIWLENNKYKSVDKKQTQGGKGGGGTTVTTTSYFVTFAVLLGEAVPGYVPYRIWLGGKLVYQIRVAGVEFKEIDFLFYDGTQTWADSRMESTLGVGNCPSYNGSSYLLIKDLDLTNYGNGLTGCPVKVELGFDSTAVGEFSIVGEHVAYFPGEGWRTGATSLNPMPSIGSLHAAISRNEFSSDAVMSSSVDTHTGLQTISVRGIESQGVSFSTGSIYPGVCKYSRTAVAMTWYETIDGVNTIYSGVWIDGGFYRNAFTRVPFAHSIEYVTPHRIYENSQSKYFLGRSTLAVPDNAGVGPNQWYLCRLGVGGIAANFDYSGYEDIGCVIVGETHCVWVQSSDESSTVRVYTLHDGAVIKSFPIDLPYNFATGNGYNRPGLFIDESNVIFLMSGVLQTAVGNIDLVVINIDTEVAVYKPLVGTGTGTTSGHDYASISLDENILCIGQCQGDYAYRYWLIDMAPLLSEGEAVYGKKLSAIVDEWVAGAGIPADEFDSSELDDDYVLGYLVQDKTSARGATEQLRAVYAFDFIESGYSIVCKKRGGEPLLEIPNSHLILNSDKLYSRSIESRVLMPSTYSVNYINPNLEYERGVEIAEYPSSYDNPVSVDFAIVMSPDDAAKAADKLIRTSWNEGSVFSFALPQIYLGLNIGGVMRVEFLVGVFFEVRIEAKSEKLDQTIAITARSTGSFTYQSGATGSPIVVENPPPASPVEGEILLMDLPLIDDSLDTAGFLTANRGGGQSWPGGILLRSVDGGQSFISTDSYFGVGVFATADNSLAAHDGFTIDTVSELKIWPTVGDFYSITVDQLLTGQNYFAYGADGRWEICQYATATANADGSITLTTLVRCLGGTEWASGLHNSGDYIVMLQDADNKFVGLNFNSIGIEYFYKFPTIGQNVADVNAQPFTYRAVNLKPPSPVNLKPRKSGNDWIVDFVERSRYSDSFWYSGATRRREPSINFEMDIYKAGSVVRTLQSLTPGFTYTSAQQIIDFGSNQSSLQAKIYQLNDRVGRGYPAEVNV